MITIYHNPRCSKSRQGFNLLETSKKNFKTVKYLEAPLSKEKLVEIIGLLKISPTELIRKNEIIWKEQYKGKTLTDDEIINAMLEHPKLMERPIVVNGNRAVIGRPPEKILEIL